jgi:FkbM family methyltransferase
MENNQLFNNFFENDYVRIDIKKSHQTINGQLSILPVENNNDLFAVVYQSYDFENTEITIKFNGVLFKTYKVSNNLFYVLLKKHNPCFFELFVHDNSFNNTPLLEIVENDAMFENLFKNGSINIIKPRISLYSLCWNEEKILPFYLSHYSDFVSQITIYDNMSTDSSIDILKQCKNTKIKIIQYNTHNQINDSKYLEIKNGCWKNDPSEYVIVCDIDELLYADNILEYLIKNFQYDVITPKGYEMVSETFPDLGKKITEQIYNGVFAEGLCKNIVFKPNMLLEINYKPGAHSAQPFGLDLKIKNFDDELKLLHYKNISLNYIVDRYDQLKNRIGELNIKLGAGNHYFKDLGSIMYTYNNLLNDCDNVLIKKNKKVFIDGGARIGESIDILLNKRSDLFGCDVYLFECNPNHIDTLNNIATNNLNYNFIVKDEAIWNENGFLDFYSAIDVWGDLGDTLMINKKEKLNRENPIKVKTIKFSDFISQFDGNDYIVLKLDIEGAEYEVLWDLINTNQIEKIDELYVEFHDGFFDDKDSYELRNIISQKVPVFNYEWI